MAQTLFPTLAFRDAHASIDFLERALGAQRVAVFEDDRGVVQHAEIRIGESAFMCGQQREGGGGSPVGTSVVYVVVADADAAHARAREAGAQVSEIAEQDYGSRDFTVTDLDGNRWSCGTYAGAAAS